VHVGAGVGTSKSARPDVPSLQGPGDVPRSAGFRGSLENHTGAELDDRHSNELGLRFQLRPTRTGTRSST
jgi:hypothetical protein